ncbi:MAG: PBP1A family penicillin-binding protein [Acidobacteria bacterium]|nr:MAG: PBP1A family penicillin-binding protein [Acidobacteriota bacterium]
MVPKQFPDQVLEAIKQAVDAVKPAVQQVKARALLYQRVVAAWVLQHQRAVAVSALAFALTLVVALAALFAGLPGREELRTLGEMPQATTLYDVHNRPVFTIFKEYRIEVPLERVSPHLRKAIVAFEDQRFEDHRGFDLIRILGAAWVDLREGRAAQGASTLTQQLARQTFLTREKRLWRKAREIALAMRIEGVYSKEEILELYLNKVYFGDGLYGAEAASRGYFGKSAADLDLSEAALLTGLVNAPSVNAPTVNMARAMARRSLVLRSMYDQGIITEEAFERASKDKVALRDVLRREEPHGQYFKEEVRQQLVKQFGWERLSEGGLRVYTTIDPAMQQAAEANVVRSLEQIEARRARGTRNRNSGTSGTRNPEPDELEGALVALDPATGEVRAMVGGRDFKSSRFNRATQALRQPGSAFKPFVYAAALEAGYSPSSLVTNLDEPIQTLQGEWMPEDEHSTESAMTVRTALRTSSNRAAVRMLEEIGVTRAVAQARKMGMGNVPSVPSLALGSGEVTLMAMTSAYASFADQGQLRPAIFIRRVEDADGTVLFDVKREAEQVLSPQTAFLMTSMLSDVVNYGTAYKARQEGFTLPAAGKTGTTNDYVDAWFVGFTPNLVTGVWIGFDKPRTIVSNGFAGELAVPLWARFMKQATEKDRPDTFKSPQGLTAVNVCRHSGQLPGAFCDRIITEYFARGSAPTELCQEHNFYVATSGQLAAALPAAGVHESLPPAAQRAPMATVSGAARDRDLVIADEAAEAPKKKRGFWSRVFGRGNDDKKDNRKKAND